MLSHFLSPLSPSFLLSRPEFSIGCSLRWRVVTATFDPKRRRRRQASFQKTTSTTTSVETTAFDFNSHEKKISDTEAPLRVFVPIFPIFPPKTRIRIFKWKFGCQKEIEFCFLARLHPPQPRAKEPNQNRDLAEVSEVISQDENTPMQEKFQPKLRNRARLRSDRRLLVAGSGTRRRKWNQSESGFKMPKDLNV